jgi:hypothetical protein
MKKAPTLPQMPKAPPPANAPRQASFATAPGVAVAAKRRRPSAITGATSRTNAGRPSLLGGV